MREFILQNRSFAAMHPSQGCHPVFQPRTSICATASHKFKSRRIRELAERYATPLPALADEVEALSVKVGEHLKRMGVVWN